MMVKSLLTVGILVSSIQTRAFAPLSLSKRSQHGLRVEPCEAVTTTKDDTADDLTKEELALRFAEVRDYYRKTNEMSQENVCLSMLRTRLSNLRLNRCVVGPSTIPQAGLGLFASRDIEQDELLTLYPGDALLIWNRDVGDFGAGDVGVMFGNHIQGLYRDASRVSTDEARSYELKIRTGHSIVADPRLVDDSAYLGHMINDGSALMKNDNSSRTLYSRTTFDRHNAAFFVMEGCHFTTIATKKIPKGEEIFVSYGVSLIGIPGYSVL
jgi:hypothetical protein